MKSLIPLAAIALAALAQPTSATVKSVSPQGIEVGDTLEVKASPENVYAALVKPALYWDSDHTYSKSAANLTLDPRAGGCFCETLPNGGGVQHMVVSYIDPGQTLRLRGALGPQAFEGAEGALTITLKPSAGGTTLQYGYSVGGYLAKGTTFWAPIIDGVVAEQMTRLARYAETGSPEPKK